MTLFTALTTAVSSLQAQTASLQTTAHNVSNANTPGFSRQRVELQTGRPNDFVFFQIGTGVRLKRIQRIIDDTLETRLRDSLSSLGNLNVKNRALDRLESILAALEDGDLSSTFSKFFGSLEMLANNPSDFSARSMVIETGKQLADTFNFIGTRIREAREALNDEVVVSVDEVNRLTDEIAALNREIASLENAGNDSGTANDLRDRRELLVKQLSELVKVRTVEAPNGELNVLAGSSFIVFGGQSFDITTLTTTDDSTLISSPVFANTPGLFDIKEGKLKGLIDSRDTTLKDFQRDIDVLSWSFMNEINKVQSTGQGLKRFTDLISSGSMSSNNSALTVNGSITSLGASNTVVDSSLIGFPNLAGQQILFLSGQNQLERRTITAFDSSTGTITLDRNLSKPHAIGDRYHISSLEYPVTNGSFKLVVTNETTGTQDTFNVIIDLDKSLGAGPTITDTTLNDIVTQINTFLPGTITASLTSDNRLRIQSSTNTITFSFAEDSSGFLAAMGLNTFFNGTRSTNMAVNQILASDPNLLSAASSNNPGDNSNLLRMINLRSQRLVKGDSSFEDFYQRIVGTAAVLKSQTNDRFENQKLINEQLSNQRQRVSGVNLEEEAINMITFQRAFQASARMITAVDEVLRILLGSV